MVLVAVSVGVAATVLTSGCLPDQLDGSQEGAGSDPALALSWAEETTAAEILDAGLVAMSQIGSVRLRQDAWSAGADGGDAAERQVISKDLLIATGSGIGDAVDGDCIGTLQLPSWGEPAELVVRDDLGAFRGGASFWEGFGEGLDEVSDGIRDVLAEQYADTWTTTPGLASLCELADFLAPIAALVADGDAEAEATRAGLGDVDGVPAARVVTPGASQTVTTWVQVAEPHLILRVDVERRVGDSTSSPTSRTVTTFSDTDTAVDVEFPALEDLAAFVLPTVDPDPDPEPVTGG